MQEQKQVNQNVLVRWSSGKVRLAVHDGRDERGHPLGSVGRPGSRARAPQQAHTIFPQHRAAPATHVSSL